MDIRLLLMDCDGVLTDGRLYFSASGEVMKVFDARDGQGIVSWHNAGFKSGIITGRGAAEIIGRRAEELNIEFVRVASSDKVKDFEGIISSIGIAARNVAYIGDNVGDIELMKQVGFPVAVADAVAQTKAVAKYITIAQGGRGAVREVIDLLLGGERK